MHSLPSFIVSDRGSQFISALWARVCQLLRIEQKLSTVYHPETDGAIKRMIQMVKNILCVSPFFLLHRYNLEVLDFSETP
ncbi:pol-like protein [Histoplasma ohiense]|nr:pol-like protein [Histoplasma ohiense (nom. inval.)]